MGMLRHPAAADVIVDLYDVASSPLRNAMVCQMAAGLACGLQLEAKPIVLCLVFGTFLLLLLCFVVISFVLHMTGAECLGKEKTQN